MDFDVGKRKALLLWCSIRQDFKENIHTFIGWWRLNHIHVVAVKIYVLPMCSGVNKFEVESSHKKQITKINI